MRSHYDYLVIGAGIVGMATAYRIKQRQPNSTIAIIDKGAVPASYQTGRNSGVIHAGVYYPPGSLKAQYCREGLEQTLAFCQQHQLPFKQCGKIIVATDDKEISGLETLISRCEANDLKPQSLTGAQINALEPAIHVKAGFKVKQTGITDYGAITCCLLEKCKGLGRVDYFAQTEVININENVGSVKLDVSAAGRRFNIQGAFLISCAGVYADALIRKQGLTPDFRIVPFKGSYYRLPDKYNDLTSHLIYPVPDPKMPFLGVHLTRMIGGYTTIGPNAVLNVGRETYKGLSLSPKEWGHTFGNIGIWKLLLKHRGYALSEISSAMSKRLYAEKVKKYCPMLDATSFLPYRSGIRAQAISLEGELIHDFKFVSTPLSVHVGNAPSPAATSAFPIADAILSKI